MRDVQSFTREPDVERGMDLIKRFIQYERIFKESPKIHTLSQDSQENHAGIAESWLELTSSLQDLPSGGVSKLGEILEHAYKSSHTLFSVGDEISAWVGQMNITEAATREFPGRISARHLAASARFGVNLYLPDEAEEALMKMHTHFTESDHPIAAEYWTLRGMILSLRKEWVDAIPCFQLAREHVENSSVKEIKQWLRYSRDDLMAYQNLNIADCLLSHGWCVEGTEKQRAIRDIRIHIDKAKTGNQGLMIRYLAGLNEVELDLLKGELDAARQGIEQLMDARKIKSRKTSILHPGAIVMKARLAAVEGDQKAMISHFSLALAETTLIYGDVMQELQVVNYALDLINRNAMAQQEIQPLLEALVMILEAKDWYTGRNHSKAVASTAVKLWDDWRGNGTDPAVRDDIYRAAYLHDIGKLRLPRSLLNKIAPLNDIEWGIIRRHPAYTQSMLEAMGTGRIAVWAGEHHQDAAGEGYPGKGPASEMGLCIAVADILEAATSPDRKYRIAKTMAVVIGELRDMGAERYPSDLLAVAESLDGSGSLSH